MSKLKTQNTAMEYCIGRSYPLASILDYAYKIKFEEKPNYDEIRFLLKKIMLDMN